MDEILSIKELIKMLSIIPSDTPFLNAPAKPHPYLKTENIAMVVGETIYDQNPTKPVGEVIDFLNRIMMNQYNSGVTAQEKTTIYLVSHMHQAGEGILGFKMTKNGVSLIRASRF